MAAPQYTLQQQQQLVTPAAPMSFMSAERQAQLLQQLAIASSASANSAAINQQAALASYSPASYYSEQRVPALNAQQLLQQSERSRGAQQL